jgi:hypothetical protein
MKFDTFYRRLLQIKLDEMLDVSDAMYKGPGEILNQAMLDERIARKWAFDEEVRAHSISSYGKDRVIERLRNSIAVEEKLARAIESDLKRADEYKRHMRTIDLLGEFISEIEKQKES